MIQNKNPQASSNASKRETSFAMLTIKCILTFLFNELLTSAVNKWTDSQTIECTYGIRHLGYVFHVHNHTL